MTTLVRAVTKLTRIKTIGLCHEVFGTRRALMQMFGTGESQIELQIAGVNHLIWLLQAKIDGRDALDLLRCHLANGGEIPLKPFKGEHMAPFQDRWRLKLALFDRYGVLPAAGDRHLAEFFPYFLANASRAATDYGVLPTTIAHRRAMLAQAKGQVRAWITGDAPLNLEPSEEEVAGIVAAVANGRSRRAVMNLPNKGQISNLPRDAVVETVGQIGPTGAHGISVGDLPLGVLSTITPHVHTSELIIEAALTGSRSLALQALLNDPLTRDFESAPRLLDDLLRAHAPFLSTFSA
jgi:alpha-galactosidase